MCHVDIDTCVSLIIIRVPKIFSFPYYFHLCIFDVCRICVNVCAYSCVCAYVCGHATMDIWRSEDMPYCWFLPFHIVRETRCIIGWPISIQGILSLLCISPYAHWIYRCIQSCSQLSVFWRLELRSLCFYRITLLTVYHYCFLERVSYR